MKTVRGNELRGTFKRYQTRRMVGLVREIPKERRNSLREEIIALANLNGVANPIAYKAAMKSFGGVGK